jgi:hypothetical protein
LDKRNAEKSVSLLPDDARMPWRADGSRNKNAASLAMESRIIAVGEGYAVCRKLENDTKIGNDDV